ncbi:hypothetical protein FQA39_LY03493 [Lamprigera yunnana]|nr:hypothetical protein FQA39_LY03493 [Lamprigera yunnana]
MVRTAAMAIKTGGKNPKSRQSTDTAIARSPTGSSSERGYTSYNSVYPRETPTWQKPITLFFQNVEKIQNNAAHTRNGDAVAGSFHADCASEAMDAEFHVNNHAEATNDDKVIENGSAHADINMREESFVYKVTKIRRRDEDDSAPKKRRKLNANMYADLEVLEI